jgi:hypothetical protein
MKPSQMIGSRFTYLVVVRLHHKDENYRKFYLCRCDCGRRKVVQATLLKTGNTKSCGCKKKELIGAASTKINGGPVSRVLSMYWGRAKKWNREFTLSFDQFKQLILSPCEYCGIQWSNVYKDQNYPGGFRYNSIDRVDSSRGYTPDNVVPCCNMCNLAKRNWSRTRFLAWVKRVARHQAMADQWGRLP